MSDFARRRIAKRKAAAAPIRQSIPTMTKRTMLAARQAGEAAVKHSAGLSGDGKLKTVLPHGFGNPLSLHWEDRHLDRIWKRDTDARVQIDKLALEVARTHAMLDILRAEGLV